MTARKPGRVSAASLMIASAAQPLEIVERCPPPPDLTDEEMQCWASVAAALPGDWFSAANTPLLAQYCRHIVHARRVAELIERAVCDPDLAIQDYDRLLRMHERESHAIASLGTKLRITQQSILTQRGNKRQLAGRKPWQ